MSVKRDTERGTWYFVVDVRAPGGTRQQVRRRGFATKKEALAAEAEVMADDRRGKYVRPSRATVSEYLAETWLPARRVNLRPSTVLGYEKVIRARIAPFIGDVGLTTLDAATLEHFYGRLLAEGGRNGGPLSPKTVANTAGVLSVALADAVRLKLVPHNAATDARLPRRPGREMTAWSEAEAGAFLASVTDDRLFPLWRLALATGMRRGELAGLRWRDVDLATGTVTVASTRVVADVVVTGEPKTRAGARVVALDRETTATLVAWRKRQAEERLLVGAGWQDHGLVFVDQLGVPPHPETITRWWREAVARSGLPAIRLHEPATPRRRCCCAPVCRSRSWRNASATLTMRVYQHVTAQDDQAAADAAGRALALPS